MAEGQGGKRILNAVEIEEAVSALSEILPADLREAHERNDEALERIYIGRRFKNDTERLEKLFELYIKMTAPTPGNGGKARAPKAKRQVDRSLPLS